MRCFKRNYLLILTGLIVYCVVWTIFCQVQHYHITRILSIAALPFGMLCAWKENLLTRLFQQFYQYGLLGLSLGVNLMVLCYCFLGMNSTQFFFCNVNSILCILALLLFSAKVQVGNQVLTFLGNIYLEIYLVHSLVIHIEPMRRPDTVISNEFLWSVIVLGGGIAGGYLLHKVCQKPLEAYYNDLKGALARADQTRD